MQKQLALVVASAGILRLPPGSVQTCVHDNLSGRLTLTTSVRRLRPTAGSLDSCLVTITLADKQQRRAPQTIRYSATHLASTAFGRCGAVRSYTTGTNQQADAPDNDYGDLIVADFNFDGRDDFAVKLDSGGNTGPLYAFYLQKPGGQFVLNSFLTEEMQYFPEHFDARQHTLTTVAGANARYMSETTYQVNTQTDGWHQVRHRLLNYVR